MFPYMRRKRLGNSGITSIVQTMIRKLRITSADLSIVLDLKQIPHTYQQFYHAFSQRPRNHQEGMDEEGRSTHMVEKGEEAEEAAVGVAEEAPEDKEKEIEIKVKIVLTSAIPPGGMGNKNGHDSYVILNNL